MLRTIFEQQNSYLLIGIGLAIFASIFALVVICIYFFYSTYDKDSIENKMKNFNESFYRETIHAIKKEKITMNIYEKIDLLLSRSQIKYNFRFDVFTFFILSILVGFLGYSTFMSVTGSAITSVVGFFGFLFIPYIILEMIASHKASKSRSQILTLIPILINNVKLTDGDIFLAIKRSAEKTKEPIKIYLEEFVAEYEMGVDTDKCFENLKNKIMDFRFARLIDNLKIHLYKGGNVIVTLNSINQEYQIREVEETRRKKDNFANAVGIYICVIANIGIIFGVGKIMPEILAELKSSTFEVCMAIAMINIMISLFIAYKSSRVNFDK